MKIMSTPRMIARISFIAITVIAPLGRAADEPAQPDRITIAIEALKLTLFLPSDPMRCILHDARWRDEDLGGEQMVARAEPARAEHRAGRERPSLAPHDVQHNGHNRSEPGDGPDEARVVKKRVQEAPLL